MLDLLRPKNTNYSKIRLGDASDSGYVIPEIVLKKCNAIFSYGVGSNWTCEKEFIDKYNKPVYMFDHTLGLNTFHQNLLHFINEGLGFAPKCDDFINHYNKLGIIGDIFLKIDIEGNEWDYFLNTDIEKIASITTGLCLEIHGLSYKDIRKKAENVLNKLEKYFTLSHIHGNNQGELFTYQKYFIPDVMELSFINKKLINFEEYDTQSYPIKELDYSNNPSKPDYELKFINN